MKKLKSTLLLLLAALLVLTSCNGGVEAEKEEDKTEARVPHERDLDGRLVVMLDAGHGFGDVGTTSDYLGAYEKDINLIVTLKLKERLEKKGVEVILSHDGESFINENELTAECDRLGIEYKAEAVNENNVFYAYERALLAQIKDETVGVDMFVSLHVNAIEKEEINGYQLFFCSDNPEKDRLQALCEDIAGELDNKCDIRSFPKDDAYIVTKYGTFPSFLVEMGYATNADDAEKLKDENFQDKLADLLAEKIYASITAVAE